MSYEIVTRNDSIKASQAYGMFKYQELFKPGPSKWMVYISVMPIIFITPTMKISGSISIQEFLGLTAVMRRWSASLSEERLWW